MRIIGADLEGAIVSWNRAAEEMYGYTAEEAKRLSARILAPGMVGDELQLDYQQIAEGDKAERRETIRVRKDGTKAAVACTLSPIKDPSGKIVGISAIERDITSRKLEETERLLLIDELSTALANVKTLRGLLPICSTCKSIRDDRGYWTKLESYISEHTDAEFTHGICPECQSHLEVDIDVGLLVKR